MDNGPQNTLKLRYGLNPQQAFAELRSKTSPLDVLSGAPGYINLLDALRGWRLVRELRLRFARPAAASFKHVNPAGAGLGGDTLDESYRRAHFLPDWSLSPLAVAYIRARQADRIASYGDFIALSDPVDFATALVIKNVASDGVIAPGFDPRTFLITRAVAKSTRERCRSCVESEMDASSCWRLIPPMSLKGRKSATNSASHLSRTVTRQLRQSSRHRKW
jgi:AICAR transformylase/IMP cyclohydrolase PurH